MFLMNMSPIPLKQTFCLRQTLRQTMKRQTVKMISCHVVHLKRQTVKKISCHVVILQSFVKKIMAHLDTWIGNTMVGGQVQVNLIGNAGVTGRFWMDINKNTRIQKTISIKGQEHTANKSTCSSTRTDNKTNPAEQQPPQPQPQPRRRPLRSMHIESKCTPTLTQNPPTPTPTPTPKTSFP